MILYLPCHPPPPLPPSRPWRFEWVLLLLALFLAALVI